jgi:hypothetical protein
MDKNIYFPIWRQPNVPMYQVEEAVNKRAFLGALTVRKTIGELMG